MAVLPRGEKDLIICVPVFLNGLLWVHVVVALGYARVLERRAIEGEKGVGQGKLGASYTLGGIDWFHR